MMKIDLTTCRTGDILTLRNGEVHTYLCKARHPAFPHVLDNDFKVNSAGRYLSSGASSLDVVDIEYRGTVDLSTVKPGDTLVQRNGEQIVCDEETMRDASSVLQTYPFMIPQGSYTKDGKYNIEQLTQHDIVRILPGNPKPLDLSNLGFGDLVKCRDGERAIVLGVDQNSADIMRSDGSSWIINLDGSSRTYPAACFEVVKILHQHPRPKFQCTATVTVETASAKAADSLVRAKLKGMVVKSVKVKQV